MLIVIVIIFGLCIGSFLNVLIDRLPRGESIIFSSSYCEHCKKKLLWYDLFPIFSYLLLKGKCRFCKARIPFQIFIVELITAVSFLFFFFHFSSLSPFPNILFALFTLSIISVFIVIFFTDLKYGIIPDQILVVLGVILCISYVVNPPPHLVLNIIAGIGSFIFFLFIYIMTKGEGMGFGDVKFSFLIGLFLGFPLTIVAFYGAFLTGAAISLILISMRRKNFKKDTIAFGPFLVIGILIALLVGDKIINVFKL